MSQTVNIEKLNQPLFADVYAIYKGGEKYTGRNSFVLKEITLKTPLTAGHLNETLGCYTPNISDEEAIVKVRLSWEESRAAYWVEAMVEDHGVYFAGYELEPSDAPMNITDDETHEAWCQATKNLWKRLEEYVE